MEVGSSFFIGVGLSWYAKGKLMDQRSPLLKHGAVRLDEVFFGEPALLDRQLAALFAVVDDAVDE